MKKIYLSLLFAGLVACLLPSITIAQQSDWCSTEILFQEKAKQDPSLKLGRELLDKETEIYVAQHQNQKSTGVVKIIPVVFHIIHEGGVENISKAQILDQLDSLNKDFRRQNADAVNTPAVFQPSAVDCEIEFRMAQLDPNGNCTDGITRHYSHLTNNARDNVKVLGYWPNNKYLNIWVVESIENTSGNPGIIIGFAQFPGFGSPLTDGVVLKHDWVGCIGTAAGNNGNGRTATHEVGHWFNLRHIWGDATCGNDLVADTPVQNVNQSTCPNFPKIDAGCNNAPNGAMFTDYMDYTNGNCQNMFSWGQNQRMQAALISTTSGRNNLWSASNLAATGTDGTPPVLCAPVADFDSEVKLICVGTTLLFNDASTNGAIVTWDWQFPGGNPSSSSSQNVSVQYNFPGTYDVILTVTNAAGTNTKTATGMVVVSAANGANNTYPFQEGFETIAIPGNDDWFILNDLNNSWEQSSVAAHTGFNSMRIYNYTGTTSTSGNDDLISTSFDLTNVSNTMLTFWRAFAYRNSSANDALKVFASSNCGQLWTLRYAKQGIALGTAGLVASNFVPSASQWDMDTVNLATTSVSGKPNVRFKFQYTQDSGNNIYIDDLNLNGIVGINETLSENVKFEVYPNPAHAKANVSFILSAKNYVELKLYDVTGREVRNLNGQNLDAGEYQFDVDGNVDNGIYYVRLTIGNSSSVKKLVLY